MTIDNWQCRGDLWSSELSARNKIMSDNLFQMNTHSNAPLAERMRPRDLDEFFGQEHIVGKGRLLRRAIEADKLTSSIFYGPPGSGKTTLARIIAERTDSRFVKLNAVTTGVAEVRKIIESAAGSTLYLLLDECHRWNKAQLDSILSALETGAIRFIGSTTENPMLSMTPAIVSRCRIFKFEPLRKADIKAIVKNSVSDEERGFGKLNIKLDDDALEHICDYANADARNALNAIELAVVTTSADKDGVIHIDLAVAEEVIQRRVINLGDDDYYDMLSAFCKSLRGSDSDAALFWAARLIYAGVDPKIILRRMFAHASEDVGMASPQALLQVAAAAQAYEYNGMPEARLNIAQAIIFICESPKSNSIVCAIDDAFRAASTTTIKEVPVHLRDTSYKGSQELGSGQGYKYSHSSPSAEQQFLPDELKNEKFYRPKDIGAEANIKKAQEQGRGAKYEK